MEEEKFNLYSITILIVSFLLFLFFAFTGNIQLQGHASEGSTTSSVNVGIITLSECGNGTIESPYEECDDGNTLSGDGCSSTCTIEGAAPPGGGGGGGGGGGISITVVPTEIDINIAVNTTREQIIYVTNNGTSTVNLTVSQQNLTNKVLFSDNFLSISPGQTKELTALFVASSKTGIFTGKIFIGGKTIYVSMNVQTKILLFDSNIVVLNDNYMVIQGDKLRTSVTLVPLGELERMDVLLNYVIKDYNGKIYLTRSETVLVENPVNFKRNFDTGILPPGKYIVGLELIYPNGVAPSSAHFEIIQRQSTLFGKLIFFLINAFLIILILIILLIIYGIIRQIIRNKKLEKEALKALEKKEKSI